MIIKILLITNEHIPASGGAATAVSVCLQEKNQDLAEIKFMLYGNIYQTKYATFSTESLLHVFLFIGTLIFAFASIAYDNTK